MKKKRLKNEVRKADALAAALKLAEQTSYLQVTRNEIAEAIGVAGSTVQYHFGTVGQLRKELMRHAVKEGNAVVVAQGLAVKDAQALKADDELVALARNAL